MPFDRKAFGGQEEAPVAEPAAPKPMKPVVKPAAKPVAKPAAKPAPKRGGGKKADKPAPDKAAGGAVHENPEQATRAIPLDVIGGIVSVLSRAVRYKTVWHNTNLGIECMEGLRKLDPAEHDACLRFIEASLNAIDKKTLGLYKVMIGGGAPVAKKGE